jgi:hypothetical protein
MSGSISSNTTNIGDDANREETPQENGSYGGNKGNRGNGETTVVEP